MYTLTIAGKVVETCATLDAAVNLARAIFEPGYAEDLAVWEASELILVLKADGRELWTHALWGLVA